MSVIWMSVGATGPTGATFSAKVDGGGPVRVAVATDSAMTSPVFTASQAVDAQGVAKVSINGLAANTRHWWQVEDNGILDLSQTGQFLTHPPLGSQASFTVGFASCAGATTSFPGSGTELEPGQISNHPVFDTIRQQALADDWLAFGHMGDLTYYNLGDTVNGFPDSTLANCRTMWDDVFAQSNQAALYRDLAFWYTWDDHDFVGGDNSDGTALNKANIAQAVREIVPHYPLTDPSGIWQAWRIGRIQFLMSDTRYYRSPNSDPDGPAKTMLGQDQKDFIANILATSPAEGLVWVMPTPWNAPSSDSWGNFATERDELAAMLISANWAHRTVMVFGDRHAIGIDSGATNLWGGFPMLQAASIDSTPSGSAADGRFDTVADAPGREQYGTIDVTDGGTFLSFTLTAWRDGAAVGSYTRSIGIATPPVENVQLTDVIRGSHKVFFTATVLDTFQSGESPVGTPIEISDGDVFYDSTGDIYSNCDIEVIGQDGQDGASLFPRGDDRLLAPFGNEIYLEYGIDLGGGGQIVTPLGYFRISRTTLRVEATIRIQGDDRMATIRDSKLITPRSYAPPQTVGTVFDDLILEVYPEALIIWDDATDTIPLGRQVIAEKDRYTPLRELAESFGKVMFFDELGRLRVETPPDPENIVWMVNSKRDGVLIEPRRMFTRDGIYNAVVVIGEGGDTQDPVKAVAIDADPNSPTRFGGPLGRIPVFHESPLVTTQAQAENAARVLLRRAIGAPYDIGFSAITNPELRPRQAVRVVYPDGNRDVHIVETVKIPLSEDAGMDVETREKAIILIGGV